MPHATMDFAAARAMMVDSQVRPNKVTDPRIIAAMRSLPRERFVPAAQASLERALELARPGGFVRLFVELGPPMRALLAGLPRQNSGTRRVLATFGGAPESSSAVVRRNGAAPAPAGEQARPTSMLPGAPVLVEQLTPRE